MNRLVRGVRRGNRSALEVRAGGSDRSAARWAAIVALALLWSCGALVGDKVSVGGETHFLITCGEDCGPALTCIEGVCTRLCQPGFSSCSELGSEAACVSGTQHAAEQTTPGGACDVLCAADADCTPLGASYTCRAGACRAEPDEVLSWVLPTHPPLTRAVDADTCLSGLRWVGDGPSAEMQPGSDCVGCHRDAGARPLLIGGTVYAQGSLHVPPPLEGCYGIEGVEVTVTDADGRERSTVTNRAGNFYFEGRESELTPPYAAGVHWTQNGQEMLSQMFGLRSYGGCARCHGAPPDSGNSVFDPLNPDSVLPLSAIFLPGLYP